MSSSLALTAFNISDVNVAKLQKLSTAEDIRLFSSGELLSDDNIDELRFGIPFRVLAAIIAKIFNVSLVCIACELICGSWRTHNTYYGNLYNLLSLNLGPTLHDIIRSEG